MANSRSTGVPLLLLSTQLHASHACTAGTAISTLAPRPALTVQYQSRRCCVGVSEFWAVLIALAGVRGFVALYMCQLNQVFLNQYDHPLDPTLWAPCFASPPPTSAMLHGVRSHAVFDPFLALWSSVDPH